MRWVLLLCSTGAALPLALSLLAMCSIATGVVGPWGARAYELPALTIADIPPLYLSLYLSAARRYELDWAVLAAIGKVECDHGRDPDPSCTHEGATNAAGAGGPAQFLAGTWRVYGVDGNGDGVVDRWNPADAIFSMANYLRASGAPDDYRKALLAYNHSVRYAVDVEHWAAAYRVAAHTLGVSAGLASNFAVGPSAEGPWAAAGPSTDGLPDAEHLIAGSRAVLAPRDGHLALIPGDVPTVVQAMVMAGNELQDLPYGTAGHPDPRGAISEDCSSTVNYVLYRSGVRPIEEIVRLNPLAQDYVHWGALGPGRWVSIYATTEPTDHVFMVIAGLRLDTSHNGTDVGPNRYEDGPRWRVLDGIPTWAHWTVRHPPGL